MNIRHCLDTLLFTFIFQHKFGDALAVLEGDLGKQLEELTSHLDLVDNKKIEYLKKLDKWEEVNALALQLLQKRFEHFKYGVKICQSIPDR